MILGIPAVSDVRDLVAAKDAELASIYKQYLAFKSQWDAKDAAASGKWLSDYQALKARYNAARALAQKAITSASQSSLPSAFDITPAGDEYYGILDALKIVGEPTKSAVGDVYSRLIAAGAPKTNYVVPQPLPGTDFDLNLYQATGNVLEAIDPGLVGKQGTSTLEKIVIGASIIGAIGTIGFTLAEINALIPRRRR